MTSDSKKITPVAHVFMPDLQPAAVENVAKVHPYLY